MDDIKGQFMDKWNQYFPGADLPIGFFYTDKKESKYMLKSPKGHQCIIGDLAKVRNGKNICFDNDTIGCSGGKRYLGFDQKLMPNFEYFLSCGIPGKLEGERYKKTPELVKEFLQHQTPLKAPTKYILFKRWDKMEDGDQPLVIIFFAPPDVLSGLFTLASFDEPEPHGVIAPFCAGCASIVDYPLRELKNSKPRAVLGMFDVSARPFVPAETLTFAVPWTIFARMVDNMDKSFLITKSWNKVKNRIRRNTK